jgi:hypothetical protein
MSVVDGSHIVVLPAVAYALIGYFVADGARCFVRAVSEARSSASPRFAMSRVACRTVMAVGMSYMLVAAL